MKTPISAVYSAFRTVAHYAERPIGEVTKKDFRKARKANLPVPVGLTTIEGIARGVGGWAALRLQAAEAPALAPIIPEGHSLKGVSTLTDVKTGEPILQWTKTSRDHESREDALARLVADLPAIVPVRAGNIPPPESTDESLLAVYPMGDPHLGMLSWGVETGEDFDLDIALRIMRGAIDNLADRGAPASEALVISLGDFFHSDTPDNRTRRSGHHLDVDGRQPKILKAGIDLMVYTVDAALRVHDRVRVITEIGNHDDLTAIFLALALDLHYRNEPRVTVDTSPARFHVYQFGRNLIATTHGDGAKPKDLAEIMAAEWPMLWGETFHRFWYTGHIHHGVLLELRGCIVEAFRTLAPRDAWAAGLGYKSGRDMNRITLHRDYGRHDRVTVSADYLEAAYRAKLG